MKLKGQLQWTDYLNSQLLHLRPDGLVRISLYLLLPGMVCGFVGGLYMFITGQLEIPIISFAPFFGFVVIIFLYRYVILPKRVKKIFYQQKELSSPFEYEFTETGMVASNEFGSSNRPWEHFNKWKENKELLMLYYSDVMYSIIPKRIFFDSQQIETVKAFLEKSKVPAAKKRFASGFIIYFILLLIMIVLMSYYNFNNIVSK